MKRAILAISLLSALMLITPCISSINVQTITGNIKESDVWSPEVEGDHFPCAYEIWFYHAILTFEDGQKWDTLATFVYFMNNFLIFCYFLRKFPTADRLDLKVVNMKFAYNAAIFSHSLHLYNNHCYLDSNPKSLVSSRIHGYAGLRCS